MGIPTFKLLRVTGHLKTTPTLYRPLLIPKDFITLYDVAEFISDKCSLTQSDVISAAQAFADEMHRWLRDGSTVDLGPLGRFSQQVEAAVPITDLEQFHSRDVRFRRIAYEAAIQYRSIYTTMSYRRDRREEQLTERSDAELAREVLALRQQYRMIHLSMVRKTLNVGYRRALTIVEGLMAEGLLQELTLERRSFYTFV